MTLNKILIIGDSGVGKTSVVNCLRNVEFIYEHVADVGMVTYIINDNFKITVFPGQSKHNFNKLIQDEKYDRIVVMCDLISKNSFENAYDEWRKLAYNLCHSGTSVVLCINKMDIYDPLNVRVVLCVANLVATKLFNNLFFVSAKKNLNIDKILED
jgi:small GTP-binding protein